MKAVDLTTPFKYFPTRMLTVFVGFERTFMQACEAQIDQAKERGKWFGRPPPAAKQTSEVKRLFKKILSKSEIAHLLKN